MITLAPRVVVFPRSRCRLCLAGRAADCLDHGTRILATYADAHWTHIDQDADTRRWSDTVRRLFGKLPR